MSEPYEKFEHNGKTITIHYDEIPTSPREDCYNLGIMLANGHRNYTLGDEEQLKGNSEYDDAARALEHYAQARKMRLFPRWCRIYLGSTVVLPLGLIDHSGISMYVGSGAHRMDPGGWDSGMVGFIFDTPSTREECGTALEHIEEGLRSEVKVYDEFLTGQVFGYIVCDSEGDEEDSCWGFYGLDYVRQEARNVAGYTCKHCQQSIHRWHGGSKHVVDAEASGFEKGGWVHNACSTCGRPVEWGGDGHYHSTMKPWDWPYGKPDHQADSGRWHQCSDGQHVGETDQAENRKVWS